MLQTLIMFGIKMLFGFLTEESKASMQSQIEMMKGRAQSVEDSHNEQDAARIAAEKAKEKAEKPGNDSDVFGSEDYNA